MAESLADKMLAKAKKVLEVGSEAADVLVHLQNGLTPLGATAVGMRVINSVRAHRAKTPEQYFLGWKPLDLGLLGTQCLEALRAESGTSCEEIAGVHERTPAVITKIDDLEIGWGIDGDIKQSSVRVKSIWVAKEVDLQQLLQRLGRALWNYLGSSQVWVDVDRGGIKLVAEDDNEILASETGDKYFKRIQQFHEKGLRRSFFFIGSPGVGKSCLLRYLASLQGGFRLRFRMSKLDDTNPYKLVRIVELLRPDVLIIDDFDRYVSGQRAYYDEDKDSPEAAAMLDPLDVFDKLVPLVLVSANYSKSITAAVLRPGRFAEMEVIDEIDSEIYEKLLPDAPKALIKQLKRLKVPVTYLDEIAKRAQVLSWTEVAKEIPKLLERADIILLKNEKAGKKKKKKVDLLTGKTPAQKAIVLDGEGNQLDRKAGALTRRATRLRVLAEKRRKQAEAQRVKAKKKVTKKKVTKKKVTKKKVTKKKVTKKKVTNNG